ncbi:MAG TPA: relaxase/mobilization nuclease RlxS [Sphingobium sp.]|uniref:relaxase/mobilization nuclease RlxS n=1 Tax=Sphingobium sp. TaxID=1912891 RepID=UPI002ED058F2
MDDGHDFTPRLGKARGKDGKRALRYGSRILVAGRLAGAKTGAVARRFDGSRIGRGASMGRILSSRDRFAGLRARRAVVKTRLVRLGPKGVATARAHLRYIQRDGVTREGQPGELYSAEHDQADGKAFLERGEGDRHQFRFIVSTEDGAHYPDLKPYVRRLMGQVEQDLGTKLDWVAVDHYNTEHPHTHIMLRGVDDRGENLIIAREYIAHGFRQRAGELATLDLGPRTDREIEERLRHDVGQERLTAIDRRLLRQMDADRIVTAAHRDPFHQSLSQGRLCKLAEMGLADDLGQGRYRLAEGLEDTLRRMGERGDIIRIMQRELTARQLERSEQRIETDIREPLIGRVIHRGFSDEHWDRHFILLDGIDGCVHHVDIGRSDAVEATPEGMVVRMTERRAEVRPVDQTVAEVAEANGGHYSVEAHLAHDPSASRAFAETHVRRLEALRRGGVPVERDDGGHWSIGSDHVERVAAYEARRTREQPVVVEIVSTKPVSQLARVEAATWLDRELTSGSPPPIRDAGFGREVRDAMAARRQWLVEQQLADGDQASVRLRANALAILQRRELLRVAGQLSREMGVPFVEARTGDRIEGRIVRRVDLVSDRFALVEKSHEFTLVPWRPMLERQLGEQVTGIMRRDGITWRFGRGRNGPQIS